MGTKAVEPQSIRNVTLFGATAGPLHRLGGPAAAETHWATDGVEHTIRLTAVSRQTSVAELEREIRVADGVIAVMDAAVGPTARLATMLRAADDHQVARLCLIEGLDRPGADFARCVRALADIRGAVPVLLQVPRGGAVIDLTRVSAFEPQAVEIYGPDWELAERSYRTLIAAVTAPGAVPEIPPAELHRRLRRLTRIGDVVPVLCGAELGPLLDAIARYLPSPMDVCQPEHALDY
ncbi:GTP-binding protein [Nocardia sp. NPDC048505]|uniref:GTP-binding protein n=1 Tax=unclassified Nocardia TaxID=2637762 RepID=UPI0033F9838D